MNTNKLMDWFGGGWRGELGENTDIALKNHIQEKLEAEYDLHDCKEESCKVCLDYLGEGKV